MLPCACSEIDPRWCQNVLKTKKWHMSHRHTFTGIIFFSVLLMFLPNFDGFCDLLNRPTTTWNLFVLYNEQKGKKRQACLVPLECSMICASSAISLVIHATFPFSASSFFFVLLVNSFSEKFFIAWGGGGDHLRNFLGGDMLLGPGNP